ncbi:MAG TPA: FAD-binding oxidoreductase [Methylomirabilota bacterium]|nr:FAD-binding oxidoreductase [Methylomirabilota bacterium]
MASTLPNSLWTATAPPPSPYPRLEGEVRADVCIIGGGFTGLSAALHLAEGGASVVVLEAGLVGSGASGRNGGQVIPGLKLDPSELEAQFGTERGARLTELVGSAADFVFDLVRRHRIECDARQDGWIKACHSEVALRAASHTARDWSRRGAAVEEIDRVRIAELTGTGAYIGGFVDHRGGLVQPLSYTRGLARAAQQAGARIHERSEARTPQRGDGHWIVSTENGCVRAAQVVIGTNGYTDLAGARGPWPKLARTVIPVYSYIAATRPMSDDSRRTILPKGQAVSDSRRLLRYFRLDAAGRMVMGGRGRTRDSADRSDYANIMASAVELYPQLRGCEWEFVWGGKVAVTLDHLPHLHELAPGVHAALGYNGRGVAMATVMGKVLADRVQGRAAIFPESPLRPVPLHRWRRPVFELIVAWKRALDRMEGVHRRVGP